jgi:hypothetical protein
MMHLLAWSGAKTDSTANEAAPAINDGVVTRTANAAQYLAPYDATILYAAAFNDTIARARFNYPSYRDIGLPEIFPLNNTAQPTADFDTWAPGWMGPRVKKGEEVGADSSNGASTVDTIHILALLGDVFTPAPSGRRFTVRGTAAQTLVASAWTNAAIAFDVTLPYGRYAVIGMQLTCAGGVAGRLIFPNQLGFRPGIVAGSTIFINDPRQNGRNGAWGEWGRFEQTAPPMLEVLGGTAGAATPAVLLDLVSLSA